jgi:hypothetical protein
MILFLEQGIDDYKSIFQIITWESNINNISFIQFYATMISMYPLHILFLTIC